MNTRINIIVYPLLILGFMLGAAIRFEAQWGKYVITEFNYQFETFTALASLVSFFFILKAVKRWMGVSAVLNRAQMNPSFDEPLAPSGFKRMRDYNFMEALIYLVFCGSLFWFTDKAIALSVLTAVMALELLAFQLLGKRVMRTVVGRHTMIILSRDLTVIPIGRVKSVSRDFDIWFFKDAQKNLYKLPLIHVGNENKSRLLSVLKEEMNEDAFFDDNLLTD